MELPALQKRLAKNIRRLADAREMSLRELSIEADVSRGALWHVLAGESAPTLATLLKVANALGVDVRELFT